MSYLHSVELAALKNNKRRLLSDSHRQEKLSNIKFKNTSSTSTSQRLGHINMAAYQLNPGDSAQFLIYYPVKATWAPQSIFSLGSAVSLLLALKKRHSHITWKTDYSQSPLREVTSLENELVGLFFWLSNKFHQRNGKSLPV